jgi:hypothetical protein
MPDSDGRRDGVSENKAPIFFIAVNRFIGAGSAFSGRPPDFGY